MTKPITARLFDTHRMVSDDGPGMRTTLFLKGCPLTCQWCHNPESIASTPQVWTISRKCIGCGTCMESCLNDALYAGESGIVIDRDRCRACGRCVATCPSGSLTFVGRDWTVDEAYRYVLKDKAFYDRSGGGVTLSGGEPTLQPEFVRQLFTRLKDSGIHTALDTCGLVSATVLQDLLPVTDLFLWDVKCIDDSLHREFTGASNAAILSNLQLLAEHIRETPETAVWLRTPLIPDITATPENIQDIARFISQHLIDVIDRWELCTFNNSCRSKYDRLGKCWALADKPLLSESDLAALLSPVQECPELADIIHVSGLTGA